MAGAIPLPLELGVPLWNRPFSGVGAIMRPDQDDSMQAVFNGTVLAESDDIVMVDGNPYFPRASMHADYFRDSSHTTVCGWKGTARYWDVVVDDQEISNAVWSYESPKPEAEQIRERFAFYRGKGVELS